MTLILPVAFASIFAGGLGPPGPGEPPRYRLHILREGPEPYFSYNGSGVINSVGQVAGTAIVGEPARTRVFLYTMPGADRGLFATIQKYQPDAALPEAAAPRLLNVSDEILAPSVVASDVRGRLVMNATSSETKRLRVYVWDREHDGVDPPANPFAPAAGGRLVPLPDFGGESCVAHGADAGGTFRTIVGWADSRASRWVDRGQGWQSERLGGLNAVGGGSGDSRAHAVAHGGWIAGTVDTGPAGARGVPAAFLWRPVRDAPDRGRVVLIPTSGAVTGPLSINKGVWVAGTTATADDSYRAFVWVPGWNPRPVPGPAPRAPDDPADWTGATLDLGSLGGGWSYALGINDWGVVVGETTDADADRLPFVWYPEEDGGGAMHALRDRLADPPTDGPETPDRLRLSGALDINDAGQIVVTGSHGTGRARRSFVGLLLPVEEGGRGGAAR